MLLSLFLDLGLRASEVAALRVEDFAEPGTVIVYRQKTDSVDWMELTRDILQALAAYEPYLRQSGVLLRGSRKNGKLTNQNMPVRAAKGSNPFVLRDADGWTNMQTPSRYVERAKVVNEGIQLDY